MTAQEAWNLVARAIRNSGYESRKEYDNLPPDIQRLVGSPEQLRDWAMMDSSTVHSVVASNFQRALQRGKRQTMITRHCPGMCRNLSELWQRGWRCMTKTINSKRKGKEGELRLVHFLREQGYEVPQNSAVLRKNRRGSGRDRASGPPYRVQGR